MESTTQDSGTQPEAPASTGNFGITDAAAAQIRVVLSDEPEGTYLRVSVDGGGCSGFQYRFDLVSDPVSEDDHSFEKGDAKVVLDSMSLEMLQGSEIDYVESLGGSAFVIKNPNATATCGCGNSFSVM